MSQLEYASGSSAWIAPSYSLDNTYLICESELRLERLVSFLSQRAHEHKVIVYFLTCAQVCVPSTSLWSFAHLVSLQVNYFLLLLKGQRQLKCVLFAQIIVSC